jgi:hypothetical protein
MPVTTKSGLRMRTGAARPPVYRFQPLSELGSGVSIYYSVLPFRYTTRGAVRMKEVIAKEFSTMGSGGK